MWIAVAIQKKEKENYIKSLIVHKCLGQVLKGYTNHKLPQFLSTKR